MANYDFTESLSPLDFEILSKDILEAELGILLENFKEGKDQGIDLRYAAHEKNHLIVQCKRYKNFSDLKTALKKDELSKIRKLKPKRYILVTSVALSPQQTDEIQNILAPFVISTGDIWGRNRLNAVLSKHAEIERRHIKLWATSTSVLESIFKARTHVVSQEEIERTISSAKIYVKNPSFDEALKILRKHHVCIICGLPGIGKTTLARMLLLYFYQKKYDVVKIESDITEARDVEYHKKPRFYYYDDFLGQTSQPDKLSKNEDQKLLDFMTSIRDSKKSRFVLTTREYILNQTKQYYEKIDREKFDHRICVIDLSKYSRRIRAQILYNHLYFSDLSKPHLSSLIGSRGYIKIVDHENYNPRLVEYLTSALWVGETSPSEYFQLFLKNLDNPVEIWGHAFTRQISSKARHLLLVLTTLSTEIGLLDLQKSFEIYHSKQCKRFSNPHSATDFKNALKELDGTFIKINNDENITIVSFQNPSIRDYMQNTLLEGDYLTDVIGSVIFFEQAKWFSETLTDKYSQLPLAKLSNHTQKIIKCLCKLLKTDTYSHLSWYERMYSNPSSRLATIALFVSKMKLSNYDEFIKSELNTLAENIEIGEIDPRECINALSSLSESNFLKTKQGARLVNVIKTELIFGLHDLSSFQTLKTFLYSFAKKFTKRELQQINNAYSDFAENYMTKVSEGNLDTEDPDELREEALEIQHIGALFGITTTEIQTAIRAYADKKEKEIEENRDSNQEDEKFDRTDNADHYFSDAELDSMFHTLK